MSTPQSTVEVLNALIAFASISRASSLDMMERLAAKLGQPAQEWIAP